MAIRKRISGNGPEDAALRLALQLATTQTERRIAILDEEIKDGTSFDADEAQKELDAHRKHLAVWKRLSSTEGKMRVVLDEA